MVGGAPLAAGTSHPTRTCSPGHDKPGTVRGRTAFDVSAEWSTGREVAEIQREVPMQEA